MTVSRVNWTGFHIRCVLWIGALCALVMLVYHPVLKAELLRWDDDANIWQNPYFYQPVWAKLQWMFTDLTYWWRYKPLCWLMWSLILSLFGPSPLYFHLVVLLFHAANTSLVFLLIRRLLLLLSGQGTEVSEGGICVVSAIAAAVWGLHPMRVETTAWAVELEVALPLFFFLLSLLCYLNSAGTTVPAARRWYWASVGLFIVSLLSFPLSLGGVVVFVLIDWFPLRRLGADGAGWFGTTSRRVWIEKVPFVLVTLLFGWVNLLARVKSSALLGAPASLADFPPTARLMQGFYMWAYYFWKPWWPFNLTPVPTQLIDFDPFSPPFLISALFVIALTCLLVWKCRQWPGICAVWLCHLALLVPALGLTEHPHYPSDHYGITVAVGWSVLLAGGLWRLWPRESVRKFALAATVALIAGLGILSYRQTFVWQSNAVFLGRLIGQLQPDRRPQVVERRRDVMLRLARSHLDHQEFASGIAVLRKMTEEWPASLEAWDLLGETQRQAGQLEPAAASFSEILRRDPKNLSAINGLGVVYAQQGRLDEAISTFSEAVDMHPQEHNEIARQILALDNLARALKLQGKANEAEKYAQQSQRLRESAGR